MMDKNSIIKKHLANSEFNLMKARNIIKDLNLSLEHELVRDIEKIQKEFNTINRSIKVVK